MWQFGWFSKIYIVTFDFINKPLKISAELVLDWFEKVWWIAIIISSAQTHQGIIHIKLYMYNYMCTLAPLV